MQGVKVDGRSGTGDYTASRSLGVVFCDMDGTLLAADKSIPALNLEALDLLAERGIPFVPCTGRPVSAVPEAVLSHPAVRFVVAANGGVVADVRTDSMLRVMALNKQCVLELYDRVRTWPITFDVFADGVVYSERARYDSMGVLGIHPATLAMLREVRTPVDLSVPQIVERACNVEKLTCFFGDQSIRAQIMREVGDIGGLACACGDPSDVEIMAPGVSKGSALVWLCEHLGLPVESSVAFGDEDNDASMLRAAGTGVAMRNATSAVKAAADCIAASNDDAGVGRYLFDSLR